MTGEPRFGEKLVIVVRTLEEHAIPHAVGGAIAYGYHADPRGTHVVSGGAKRNIGRVKAGLVSRLADALDKHGVRYAFGGGVAAGYYLGAPEADGIDLMVFEPASAPGRALGALAEAEAAFGATRVREAVESRGQARVEIAGEPVDVFFEDLPFLASAAGRVRRAVVAGREVRILSAEDLVVCKALFNRREDWQAIEQLLYARWPRFQHAYARDWLIEMMGTGDPRVRELDLLVTQVEQWERSRRR